MSNSQAVADVTRLRQGVTPCHLDECGWPSHVILFAAGTRFAGHDTQPGQTLGFCLKHGGQLYDVLRAIRDHQPFTQPTWLPGGHNQLPRITPNPGGWTPTDQPRGWRTADTRPARTRR